MAAEWLSMCGKVALKVRAEIFVRLYCGKVRFELRYDAVVSPCRCGRNVDAIHVGQCSWAVSVKVWQKVRADVAMSSAYTLPSRYIINLVHQIAF